MSAETLTVTPLADRLAAPRLWRTIGVTVFILVAFVPVAAILLATARWLIDSPAAASLITPWGRRLPILVRSVARSGGVALAAMTLGLLIASAFWRPGPAWFLRLRWVIVALAPIPAYVHALAWTSFGTQVARLLRPLLGPGLAFTGPWAAMWVSTMALLPLAVGLAIVATESVPRGLRELAQVYRSDDHVLWRVVLPLAMPILAMGACVLFLLDLLDFSVPSLFQISTYALEVFVTFSNTYEVAVALITALPLLVVSIAVVVFIAWRMPRAMQATTRGGLTLGWRPRFGITLRALQVLGLVVLVFAIGVPVVSLVLLAVSTGDIAFTLAQAWDDTVFTFATALVAALAVLPLGLAVAAWLDERRRRGWLAWLVVCLPLAVPPALVGIGLIVAYNTPVLPLHGTAVMPVLAALARFTPLAALILYAQRQRLDRPLVDMSRVLQRSDWQGWSQVTLPLMAPGLFAAACLTFALTLGELGATLLVAPPGRGTLTLRIFNNMHFGASDRVAALCLVLVAASLVAAALGMLALAGMARAARTHGSEAEGTA